ncbi:MAG TPA: PGPGW domain-containing protein [Gemmatimonadaceae bacterium]|jgi:hypothetical protein
MLDWADAHKSWFAWLAVASAVMLIASALLIPWLVAKLPTDYFARDHHPTAWSNAHPLLRAVLLVGKNLLGVVLILLGILMLVLPGQGVLTIVAGIALVDVPGRHRVMQWIVARDPVMNALNWVRRRAKQPEFQRVNA